MDEVDMYLQKLPTNRREVLQRIRSIILSAVPDSEEGIFYNLPGFRYQHRYFLGYGAFTSHLSIFPAAEPIERLQDKLTDYKLSKGTIQFQEDQEFPESLLLELIHIRLESLKK